MNKNISIITIFILAVIFILVGFCFLSPTIKADRNPKMKELKDINFLYDDDLKIKCYFICPFGALTPIPITKDIITTDSPTFIVEVPFDVISLDHVGLFDKMTKADFTKIEEIEEDDVFYRIYCEIYQKDKLISSFGLEGLSPVVINNRYRIKYDPVFYEIAMLFLPSCAVKYYPSVEVMR